MLVFSSSDINFPTESPVFRINEDRDFIEQISYVDAFGSNSRNYRQKPHFYTTLEHQSDEQLILSAAIVLCRLNPREFSNLYNLVQSKEIKAILDEALASVKNEYGIESADTPVYEAPEEHYFMVGSYFVSAGFDRVITDSVSFRVGESRSLLSVVSKTKNACTGKIITEYEYGKMLTEDALYSGELTDEKCTEFAKILCQSSFFEYQKLLEYLDPNDPYYNAIKNGLKQFSYDVQMAENTIKQR